MSVKQWLSRTKATGLIAKAGRYGGTYAHKDIAFEFASWISPKFKLYLIKEFQRLKDDEIQNKSLEWNLTRSLRQAQLPHPYRRHPLKTSFHKPTPNNKQGLFTPPRPTY